MPLSRFRLRLAAWFALAFVLGVSALNLALYGYWRHQSAQRLTQRLHDAAADLTRAIQFEYRENPGDGLIAAAHEAFMEWPHASAFAVYSAAGRRLTTWGDTAQVAHMPTMLGAADTGVAEVYRKGAPSLRQVSVFAAGSPRFLIRASGSTQPIEDESEALVLWLGLTSPIVVISSLIGGYILSRRALTPIERLGREVAAIAPDELDRRLPVGRAPDEIDHLAAQFNALLERLQRARQQNRRFVQQAAHQIRTPLTLVLGEAELSLDRPRTVAEQRQTLERIRTAASQMKRRVDELRLLAQAEAGERPVLDETIELDGLVFECADLMRARAQHAGQRLELLRVEPVSVRGNEALLKEAVLELIENACRYGTPEHAIGISAFGAERSARLQVGSVGEPLAGAAVERAQVTSTATSTATGGTAVAGQNGHRGGLGLTIVRWIASEHGGALVYRYEMGRNVYQIDLPALPEAVDALRQRVPDRP